MRPATGGIRNGAKVPDSTTDCGRHFCRAVGQASASLTKLIVWMEERRVELSPDLLARIEGLGVIVGRYSKASGAAVPRIVVNPQSEEVRR